MKEFLNCSVNSAANKLVKASSCTCPGYVSTYECTTVGGTATVWQGSAFQCPSSQDSIYLSHSLSNIARTCNGVAIRGQIIRDKDDCHTSQLNVTVSSDMIGESIECFHDNGIALTLIGNDSIEGI